MGGFFVRAAPEQTVALHPPATADYVPRAPICRLPPETNQEPVMGELIQLRDFKRKEEREAADVRLAKQIMGLDTAPCEMPLVWPSYEAPESDPA